MTFKHISLSLKNSEFNKVTCLMLVKNTLFFFLVIFVTERLDFSKMLQSFITQYVFVTN